MHSIAARDSDRASGLSGNAAAVAFCIVAAVSATLLPGIHFPDHNNMWHVPVVLHYAASAEGPHDSYDLSFSHFVSAFWLVPSLIATEANVRTIFVTLQLIGNAALAVTLFFVIRRSSESNPLVAGVVTGFFCFCYGLWGSTRLGYSEMFVTYATHTQYSIVLCLAALAFLLGAQHRAAALALSLAADCNLFMAAWTVLAAGAYLVASERRILTRRQVEFSLLFLVPTVPVVAWGLKAAGNSAEIPLDFIRSFIWGHVYALELPQAAAETFALGLSAALASLAAGRHRPSLGRLGMMMLICVVVLAAAAAMPYATDDRLLLLLHPLRFSSIVEMLSAACAGALVVEEIRHPRNDRLAGIPVLAAAAGFLLKNPTVSIFGFALAAQSSSRPLCRWSAMGLAVAGLAGMLLKTPIPEVSLKSAFACLLICGILAVAAWGGHSVGARSDRGLAVLTAGAIAGAIAVPPGPVDRAALLACIPAVLAALPPAGRRGKAVGLSAASLAIALVLFSTRSDLPRLGLLAAGPLLSGAALFLPQLANPRWNGLLRTLPLAGLVGLFMAAGLARGAVSSLAPSATPEQRAFAEAGQWARSNTPIDATFLPVEIDEKNSSFTLFSRRPVWWEHYQGAAVLWMPSFYGLYSCRERALSAAMSHGRLGDLAVRAGIDYLILKPDQAKDVDAPGFRPVFRNAHFVIFANANPRVPDPLCPDPQYGTR